MTKSPSNAIILARQRETKGGAIVYRISGLLEELNRMVVENIARSPQIDPIRDHLQMIGFREPVFVPIRIEFNQHSGHSVFIFRTTGKRMLLEMNPQFPRRYVSILRDYAGVAGKILGDEPSIVAILNKIRGIGYKNDITLCISGQATSRNIVH